MQEQWLGSMTPDFVAIRLREMLIPVYVSLANLNLYARASSWKSGKTSLFRFAGMRLVSGVFSFNNALNSPSIAMTVI